MKWDDLETHEIEEINLEIKNIYQKFPIKVAVKEGPKYMKTFKDPFYIIYIPDLLEFCGDEYIFYKF